MDLFMQLVVSGVIMGCIYVLIAMGYGLIYGTTGEFHVAHGGVFTFSGYFGYMFLEKLGLNLVFTLILTAILAAVMGMVIQTLIFEPMRRKGASHIHIFIASMGMLIILENLSSLLFGVQPLNITNEALKKPIDLGSFIVTPLQIIIMVVTALVVIGLLLFLRYSKFGIAIRGVSDSKEMATIVGIKPARINLFVYAIGSAVTAPAGVLLAMESGATPFRGTFLILLGAMAMIIGGIGSVAGAAIAAMLMSLVQNLAVWQIPAEWMNVIMMTVLLVIIFVRPQGIFGAKMSTKV